MKLAILGSTSRSKRPIQDRRNVVDGAKQLESMVFALHKREEGGLSVGDKTNPSAPPLIMQVWEFM